ncbi:hypothetical protein AAMO2058_000542600 [Amorphochlora amoebiformis]
MSERAVSGGCGPEEKGMGERPIKSDEKREKRKKWKKKSLCLVLIRHAQSEYNLRAEINGGGDPYIRDAPLTAEGRRQAKKARPCLENCLKSLLKKFPNREIRVLCSPLSRAVETAVLAYPKGIGLIELWPCLREFITGSDDIGTPGSKLSSIPLFRLATGLGTQKPLSGTQKPLSGTQKPLSGTQNPPSGTQKPLSGTPEPGTGTQKPEFGTQKPEFGTQKPGFGTQEGCLVSEETDSKMIGTQRETRAVRSLREIPDIWWTVPSIVKPKLTSGEDMFKAYQNYRNEFKKADELGLRDRVIDIQKRLAAIQGEPIVIIVSHYDLLGNLTRSLELFEPYGEKGWWLDNAEVRSAEAVEVLVDAN